MAFAFCSFFFFSHAFQRQNLAEMAIVHALCMNSSRNFWLFSTSVGPVHCSQDPQTLLFSNFFIKNGSHGIIHTFKNYFVTVFSVFSFQFQQNKFYPNGLKTRCYTWELRKTNLNWIILKSIIYNLNEFNIL